ncbi:Sterol desaturase/sphingolipid hydroxylase, fatty acid hydroxylase superfamily [Zhouia amylolytica]|uniref:Sterol desaturase/sphingolipid hydroxylase, fatty acid hydroxylase superfamily n=1 Tax=Zhouia amylolytica TaxID=376730 RepID=A0A1I6U1D9_9FLAO|nr:sterol desaturase family protein [Zhouia amylolytica]MCQ0111145.1 sterol desaturase family protein [Zhouia amylolytica]SFS95309.1 Sterol desaturase/sphingolipid hydroxylase, fatty acid hydroxylase superfamily [Zhouia amylolytica]
METIIDYFSTIPSSHRSLILVSGITFFWLLEYATPLFRFNYKKLKHAWPNIFFTLTTILVNFILAFILLLTSDWTIKNNFGVLQWLSLPLWATILLGVLLLDLTGAYLAHWVQHKIKPLWLFHLIHHTDNHVDTTTANRHHPGESIIRFVFTTLGVFILGAPVGILMLYQSLSVVCSQFNHANIRLPKNIDNMISWIIVSPDMHKVHHHYLLPYTDTNYGNIFSIWDRLFGTFAKIESKDLVYGVDSYPDVDSNTRIGKLLKLPFNGYRPPAGGKFD